MGLGSHVWVREVRWMVSRTVGECMGSVSAPVNAQRLYPHVAADGLSKFKQY